MTENLFDLDTLFTYAAAEPLTEAAEAAAITAAQAGDEAATLQLLAAYGPVLRSTVAEYKGGLADGQLSARQGDYSEPSSLLADLRQAALLGFMEALQAYDPAKGARLAGIVRQYINDAVGIEANGRSAFEIPKRTLTRFFGIMAEADNDLEAALALAPKREMAADTFMTIYRSLAADSLESLLDSDTTSGSISGPGTRSDRTSTSPVFAPSPVVDVEDRILCDAALRACDDDEHRVVSLQYGFQAVVEIVDGDRVQVDRLPSDREIGDILGMTRPTVQRRGKSALGKMRKALSVTVGDVR